MNLCAPIPSNSSQSSSYLQKRPVTLHQRLQDFTLNLILNKEKPLKRPLLLPTTAVLPRSRINYSVVSLHNYNLHHYLTLNNATQHCFTSSQSTMTTINPLRAPFRPATLLMTQKSWHLDLRYLENWVFETVHKLASGFAFLKQCKKYLFKFQLMGCFFQQLLFLKQNCGNFTCTNTPGKKNNNKVSK